MENMRDGTGSTHYPLPRHGSSEGKKKARHYTEKNILVPKVSEGVNDGTASLEYEVNARTQYI